MWPETLTIINYESFGSMETLSAKTNKLITQKIVEFRK
jgi:hypothetical protein